MSDKKTKKLPENLFLRDGVIYFRARIGGKLKCKKANYQGPAALTNQGNPRPALLQELAEWIGYERCQAELRRRNPDAAPEGSIPSWEQLVEVYQEIAKRRFAEDGRPTPATVKNNVQRLLKLLKDIGVAKTEPLTSVTAEEISEWNMERVSSAQDTDKARYVSMRILGQVTSIWAKWTLEFYERRGLVIPASISRWPDIAGVAPRYKDPPDALKRATVEGGRKLAAENPSVWLTFALMFHTGMRPGDAERAEWAWFRELPDGRAKLTFTPNKTRRSARGRQVEQVLTKDFWGRLCAARKAAGGTGPYVVPGAAIGRQKALETVNDLMRAWGWTTYKASYELRKLFVSAVYNKHGLMWAASYSGDNPMTIERYYTDAYRRDAPSLDVAQIVAGVETVEEIKIN